MSRINSDQIKQALKARLAPVYIVTGDETLLVQETCDIIRESARKNGFTERELYHSDSHFSWDQLNHSANSLSLFSEKKIIEIRIANGKINEAASKAIREFCDNTNDETLLLIILPKMDKRAQQSAWAKAVDKVGVYITVWPIGPQQLPRWVGQRLKSSGLSANSQSIEILCTKVEGNLLAAAQEIEKLKLLADTAIIDEKLMASAVMESQRYDIFSLVDKALFGQTREAVENLHGLRGEGTEAPVILWALSREVRNLSSMKEDMQHGASFDMCARKNGIWDKRKPLIRQALQRLKLQQLYMLMRKLSYADKSIKGMTKADAWNILLDIVLSLSGTETLHPKLTKNDVTKPLAR